MMTQCWEEGLTCRGCGKLIPLGGDMLYKQHPSCARRAAEDRRTTATEDGDVVAVARLRLAAKGRIVLTRKQLRELITLAAVVPVHKPDLGRGRMEWYSRLSGWDPARLERGLTPAEVAGLWEDHLDIGRMPAIRHQDLSQILTAIDQVIVTTA